MRATTACLSALVGVLATFGPASARAQESPSPAAEVAFNIGAVSRYTGSGSEGIDYDTGLGWAINVRAVVLPWLRVTAYYLRSNHELGVPHGAAFLDYEQLDVDSLFVFSIGAQVEPSVEVAEHLRLGAIAGIGWGRATLDRMHVVEASRSYTVQDRAGVFLEAPLGASLAWEIIPRHLSVRFESTIAPHFQESGNLFDPVQFVDDKGRLGYTGALPEPSVSLAQMLGVSLLL